MKKLLLTLAAMLLVMMTLTPLGSAQSFGNQEAVGTWTFFVTINGAPPCQCIQIARFSADGTLSGPGNDHFTGAGVGEWKKTGFREITFVILQNAFNPDGTAGGEYVIKSTMNLNPTGDIGTGTSSFQLLDNAGKVLFAGTATFRATKLKLD